MEFNHIISYKELLNQSAYLTVNRSLLLVKLNYTPRGIICKGLVSIGNPTPFLRQYFHGPVVVVLTGSIVQFSKAFQKAATLEL